MAKLNILACQIHIPAMTMAAERDAHLKNTAAKLHGQLTGADCDMVVLPELSSIDYSRASFSRLDQLAEDLDGPSFRIYSALAREFGVAVVYGFARKAPDGYHISQAAVDERGEFIGHFDKLHVAQYGASMEKEYFQRGSHLFVFDYKGVRIAPIICYDIRIPELPRTLAVDHGAQLILHCGAYARDESFYSWHHFSVSRAIENQVCFLSLNRAGEDYGNSLFCPPWVDENNPATPFPAHDEAFQTIEVDTDRVAQVRERYPFLADRFEDYGTFPALGLEGQSGKRTG